MKEIARDLYLLRGFPPAGFNVYVIRSGDRWVLVDTSTRHARRRIMRQLPGPLESIFITHAHRDNAGEMPEIFTSDKPESRRSIRKLAALEPVVVCFGHGRPLTKDAAAKLQAFAADLPVEHPTP